MKRTEKFRLVRTTECIGLFTCERGDRLIKEQRVIGTLPLLTAGIGLGQGIAAYIQPTFLKQYNHCITIDMFGNTFFHNYVCCGDDNIHFLLNDDISDDTKLYIAALLDKQIAGFSYSKQFRMSTAKNMTISLPILTAPDSSPIIDPTHTYSSQGFIPDFAYMEHYVAELEAERVAELEAERVAELEAYLRAADLNNYELTEDDREVLEKEEKGEIRKKEFRLGELFDKCDVKRRTPAFDKANDLSRMRTSEFPLPLANAKNGDNGIMYYGRATDWDSVAHSIDIVNDGAVSVGNVYAQPDETGVLYNAYLIKLKADCASTKIDLFLAATIQKMIKHKFGYDNKATWDKVQDLTISLPVDSEGNICFAFMEKYIKAIEKLSIAGVVQYKDKVITETKKLIS